MGQLNWLIIKKQVNNKKLWDTPQQINMNHTNTQALVKPKSKLLMNKIKNGNSTQVIRWDNMYPICIQECAPKIFLKSTISFAQKV
jgi:hypothetical protein